MSNLNEIEIVYLVGAVGALVLFAIIILLKVRNHQLETAVREEEQSKQFRNLEEAQRNTREAQLEKLSDMQSKLEQRFADVQKGLEQRLGEMSSQQIEKMASSNEKIQETLHKRLVEISGQVEQRLDKGFEKTTQTFTDVVKRLAIIDEAQKKITELSSNVVSLQEVLSDKRSRGAFGEVQMTALIRNILPEDSFELQYGLSNGTRVDCMLFLPEPTGNVPLDSKFPLDTFKRMMDKDSSESDRLAAERQFKQDIKKHINDIADKYIIQGETSDGAIMFIPAEAVFAEIHAHQPELVELAQQRRVWMASPTTLMAVLTTARAVIRDSATRQQVHLIQEHLAILGKDFQRFQERMTKLSTHIRQAHDDVKQVNTSANKITSRFVKIEKVELDDEEEVELLEQESEES